MVANLRSVPQCLIADGGGPTVYTSVSDLQVVAAPVLPQPPAECHHGVTEPGDRGRHVPGAAGRCRAVRYPVSRPVLPGQVPCQTQTGQ